jgi:hypothetical protein
MTISVDVIYAVDAAKFSHVNFNFLERLDGSVQLNGKALNKEPSLSVSLQHFVSIFGLMNLFICRSDVESNSGGRLACSGRRRLEDLPVMFKVASEKWSAGLPIGLDVKTSGGVKTSFSGTRSLNAVRQHFINGGSDRDSVCIKNSNRIRKLWKFSLDVAFNFQGIWPCLLCHQMLVPFLSSTIGSLHSVDGPPSSKHSKEAADQRLEVENNIAPRVPTSSSLDRAWSSKNCGGHYGSYQNEQNEDLQSVVTAHGATSRGVVHRNHGITRAPILQGRAA